MRVVFTLALVLSAAATSSGCMMSRLNQPFEEDRDNPAWTAHIEQCAERHPGYNPLTNTYPDNRGRMKLC